METNKLVVISVDAMVGEDIEFARTLPAFSRLLENAAVAEIEAIFPTLTYPNHTAQLTGCGPATSGIYNNLQFQPAEAAPEWFWYSSAIKVPTVLDAAKAAGLTTSAIQWPATAQADVDLLIPEIWDLGRWGGEEAMYRANCSTNIFEKYYPRHRDKIIWSPKREFNEFACSIAEEVLLDEQPDVMFLHLVAVDAARHLTGPFTPEVQEALRQVDGWLGRLLTAVDRAGNSATTNVVIVSDHGHLATEQHTNLNALFKERGFLRVDESAELVDYDVFCHGAGLSAQLFLAADITDPRRAEVEALLREIEADPFYRVEKIHTELEARERYGLAGPFDYVVESEPGVLVGMDWNLRSVVIPGDPDFVGYVGNHGHAPQHGAQPVFIGSGPDFAPGTHAGRRTILDEAPTFAAVLGLELPHAEGTAITELLAPAALRRVAQPA